MRRHHGRNSSPFASKVAAPVPDAISLIRNFHSESNPSRPVRPSPLAASQLQGMPLDLVERIRSFPLFQTAPDSFLAEVGNYLRPQMSAPHDYILTEGEDAKSMYWVVRGAVAVTSRDGESTYAELKQGAFFGEIGILMDRPRTASVIATARCLLVVLTKEDLRKILPSYPDVEQAIREEAKERLAILERKKKGSAPGRSNPVVPPRRGSKRNRDKLLEEMDLDSEPVTGVNGITVKKRKSPSPGINDAWTSSALGNGLVNVRSLLKELPLFANLPTEILHFLGLNAQPKTFAPFQDIIKQDSRGREVYFIVKGEVEVLDEKSSPTGSLQKGSKNSKTAPPVVKARLKNGQYFGEVVSLSLAPRRTATVRSISSVECLVITGEVLQSFWERCPLGVRQQIEDTAKRRLESASDNDVVMEDAVESTPAISELEIQERPLKTPRKQNPSVTFSDMDFGTQKKSIKKEDTLSAVQPSDPDPFLNPGLDNIRSRSRRGSLAPIPPDESPDEHRKKSASPPSSRSQTPSPAAVTAQASLQAETFAKLKRAKVQRRYGDRRNKGLFPKAILLRIFSNLRLHEALRARGVCLQWSEILTKDPSLFNELDLTRYNRKLTDEALTKIICPFVGARPRIIDISNCFHITDEGFNTLASLCGTNVTSWKMKSVWDVTAPAILEMSNKAKGLEEVDLSNCRKVSDTLLARIVGWVVPNNVPNHHNSNRSILNSRNQAVQPQHPAPGTVFGCPSLKRLTLSYCKHVTDRSMHHIACHAASRVEQVDLTRCTTITDTGFQYWGNVQFARLRRLCLADCTYLTDNAIIYLTNAAKGLQELDLSFCCALSDTSTEVLALGCPSLTYLNLSFCGSAVSDPSLQRIGMHLSALRELSVRGCVRVTGTGVEVVAEGCHNLSVFDVSQCKNLAPWLEAGEDAKYGGKIRYETVGMRGRLVR
ncbi:MAG: hypothetical protein Q9160_006176 [Pyrenula sp. 1 TL-2023]